MATFLDKPIANVKQIIAIVITAAGIGGGIVRFEIKSNTIENKLDTIIAAVENTKIDNNKRFERIEHDLIVSNNEIRSVTTSLTAMLKPEDIIIKKR